MAKEKFAVDRRAVLAGLAAVAALPTMEAAAATKPRRIDVHHHILAPRYLERVRDGLIAGSPYGSEVVKWTTAGSLEQMDRWGIATALLSTSGSWTEFTPEDARDLVRHSNDYAAQMRQDHPGRFGVFAMLPLPYIDESLKEIAYAFDTLKADGVGMMTNYGDKWLGYAEFAPVFEELNRRKAVVYTHPMSPGCCVNLVKGVSDAAVDWASDTTRTMASLIFSGAAARYSDINFIFSHGGGVITSVAERFRIQMVNTPPYKGKFTRDMVDHELTRFYYDTAQVANEVTIQALAKLVPVSQILFGTDFPYRSSAEHVAGLTARFDAQDLAAIGRGNALRILPAWRNA